VVPRELIDTAQIPGEDETLRLIRRGDAYSIMLGSNELMNSRLSGSEEALATLVHERLGQIDKPRILIGGFGMGFTLRAALAAWGEDARMDVCELVPQVVEWARGPMVDLSGTCLDDLRTSVIIGDVRDVIRNAEARYNAILLDVDNGPDGITHKGNDQLYAKSGLNAAKRALRPGGILAVWSSGADPAFTQRLQSAGFAVEECVTFARRGASGKKGARHMIWIATKAG
jgi:spermidine synthase